MQKENEELFAQGQEEENNQDVFGDDTQDVQGDMQEAPEGFGSDYEIGDVSNTVKGEVRFREEDEDKVFVIETAKLLEPITRDEEGNFIEPKPFNKDKVDSKKGYQTKVKITYKDSDYVSLIPNVKWYPGLNKETGKKILTPWFVTGIEEKKLSDNFTPEISKVHYKFCIANGYEPKKISKEQFLKELVGKKVRLESWETDYEGQTRYRVDIKEFV